MYRNDINSHLRILIVDDESTIVEEIVDSLILRNCDAAGLCDPHDALNVLAADPRITVLMTDLDMPSLNGLELAERILTARTDKDALEVVLLTAHADLDAAIAAMRIGVFDLLRKPARIATVKDTLERAHRKASDRRKRYRSDAMTANGPIGGLGVVGPAAGPPGGPVAGSVDGPVAGERLGTGVRPLGDAGVGSFLSVISHELRTPLNPIIGFSQLIEKQHRTLDEGELTEYARYIREAGESLFELTASVLKVTELKERPPRPIPEWVRPGELLERLRTQHLAAAAGREQTIEIEPAIEEFIHVDGDLLLQALSYLLANAVRFSPGGSSIALSARALGEEMSFQIADNGPGMTPIEIDRALRPFEQLDLRHNRSHGGLGVGLTLASLLAASLRGRLELESRPAAGTNATVWIPLNRRLDASVFK